MGWINLAELRERIRRMAEQAAREEGLGDVRVRVHVDAPDGLKPRTIEVEVMTQVDGTDPRWEPMRGGKKWQDN